MNKIVFLDAYTMHPEEVDLTCLGDFGECSFYDRTLPHLVVERAKEANIILTNKTQITKEHLSQLPHLKYIGVTATGYNCVDTVAAKEHGVVVSNAAGYSTASVAQQTFAMILSFANRLSEHSDAHKWSSQPDFCYYDYSLMEISGATLGLIGYGEIAQEVGKIASAFGMKIIFTKPSKLDNPANGAVQVDLDTLLELADFVSLHCPLNTSNSQMMNKEAFAKMKKTSVLINTARGGLVNETDLAEALGTGQIAGAYLDVLTVEPPAQDHVLFEVRNCKISPHIAWASLAARQRLLKIVHQNIAMFLKGKPKNVVN